MDVGVGFLERNNIFPVFFLFEKNVLTYSHLHLDLEGILDHVHLHFKGEEIEAQSHYRDLLKCQSYHWRTQTS